MQAQFENSMNDDQQIHTTATIVSQVFGLVRSDTVGWDPQELGEILAHQMSAPLMLELNRLRLTTDERRCLEELKIGPDLSFGDLFAQPMPHLALLNLVKEYAKAGCSHPSDPIPGPICVVLYYASIAIARLRHKQSITTVDDGSVRRGLVWVLERPWLDPALLPIFDRGLEIFHVGV